MPTWPPSLPGPALNTLTETPPKNKIRSQTDKGPPKERRRTTANVRPIAFILKLTPTQTAALDTFFVTDTASGVNEFNYTHPRTGAAVMASFAEEPTYSDVEGKIYNCAVKLEIQP